MKNPLAQVSFEILCFWVSIFEFKCTKKGKDKETSTNDDAETVKIFCKCMNKGQQTNVLGGYWVVTVLVWVCVSLVVIV